MPLEDGGEALPPRSRIVELRQYRLLPQGRATLVDLFDRYFVDPQESCGSHVIGQFEDLDDPNKFVWLRGFDSMPARREALSGFYYGPVWKEHRAAANATMADSDDVLLLAPLRLGDGYPRFGTPRLPGAGSPAVTITVWYREAPIDAACRALVRSRIVPELAAAGADPIAVFASEPAENTFPALPVRAENVVVWISRFDDDEALDTYESRLARSPSWARDVVPQLSKAATQPLQRLRLRPTTRSHLR